MRTLLVIASGVALGCATHQVPVPLEQSLRLDVHLESTELAALTTARVKFSLRNTSSVSVDFCQLDGGVTIAATIGRRVVPVKGFGAVLDVPCYKGGTLRPGEAREFDGAFSVVPGTTSIKGSIRIHRPRQGAVEIQSVPVPVSTAG